MLSYRRCGGRRIRNILIVGERRGRIDSAKVRPIPLRSRPASDPHRSRASRRRGYGARPQARSSAYDAIYLELASRGRLPIATLDRTLAAAADASGVPVIGEGSG